MITKIKVLLLHFVGFALLSILSPAFVAAIPVFPEAKGFGTETRAAYGAKNPPIICIVTNTEHSGADLVNSTRGGVAVKTGSLKSCIAYPPPPDTGKLIIFEVSGTINATNTSRYYYAIEHPYTTIAGQTAPSPGITLRNLTLRSSTHDVLIQHLRIRVGDAKDGLYPDNRRNIEILARSEDVYNNVIDHCSFSWGVDINTGMGQYDPYTTTNVTWSNNIISEPLSDSLHLKGEHSKGMSTGRGCYNISVLNNLFAHSVDRNPIIQDGGKVVANNLMYNCRDYTNNITFGWGPGDLSIVANHIKGGPNSSRNARNKIGSIVVLYKDGAGTRAYINGNMCAEGKQSGPLDWALVDNRYGYPLQTIMVDKPPIWPTGFKAMNVEDVEDYIITNAGARPADRDSVDHRIINDVIHRSGRIIDSPSEVGGWPNLKEYSVKHVLPSNPHNDNDNDGYTNLEEWLQNMANSVEKAISTPQNLFIK